MKLDRKADRVAVAVLILVGLTALYATAIEPYWLMSHGTSFPPRFARG